MSVFDIGIENALSLAAMDYDKDKVDDAVLALLYLTRCHDGTRAWKGHDWNAMQRLHQKGYLADPRGKAKSVVITDEGRIKAEQLFRQLFTRERQGL
jgi:hypothetical protein